MAAQYVSDVMSTKVYAVREDESLAEIFRLMEDHNFRHVPVVDDERDVVGIVSERDILKHFVDDELRFAAQSEGEYLANHPVTEVMTADPATVTEDTPLAEACRLLWENKFDCLPVVDNQRLVGILTTSDILRTIAVSDSE